MCQKSTPVELLLLLPERRAHVELPDNRLIFSLSVSLERTPSTSIAAIFASMFNSKRGRYGGLRSKLGNASLEEDNNDVNSLAELRLGWKAFEGVNYI